ncbi:MAG TPA: excinuclease ABC subunit A [Stellaceae bacterium]|nr:excinuclease ABC subunit A [Stellaceae bacterium]
MRIGLFLLLALFLASGAAEARNTEYHLAVADVLHAADTQQKLGNDVAFYFGKQSTPSVAQRLGDYVTNRKSNSFGRPDQEACQRAMLDALIALRDRAKELGGNAVIDIVSYYKKDAASSETDYECHAGGFVAGVALKGTVVKLSGR